MTDCQDQFLERDGRAGRLPGAWAVGRHCTEGQYGYVPLGRHLVIIIIKFIIVVVVVYAHQHTKLKKN